MRFTAKTALLTFLGGAIGACARFSLNLVWDQFWSLILINLLGAALLGFLASTSRFDSETWKALLGTGFAGGFTSMSAVAVLFVETSLVSPTVWSALILVAHMILGAVVYLVVKKVTR
jgi:fluoride ion exporter CrcB/FEX